MSVTAVPLRPVTKGTLTALWLGILALVLIGAAAAWFVTRVPVVEVTTVTAGKGPSPTDNDIVLINYQGRTADGKEFDSGNQSPLPVKGVVPGFADALKQMQVGGKYTIVIPPALGYADQAEHPLHGKELTFDVQLLDFRSEAEVRMMQQQMQQMQQMQQLQGGPGGPGAPGEAAPPR